MFTKASVEIRPRANIRTYLSEEKQAMYQDKTLKCRDCGNEFVFTAGEQEFYASKGFENEPTRCKDCRLAKKNAQRGEREMFSAVCAECGNECQVPFKPNADKPVYCSDCFAAKRADRT